MKIKNILLSLSILVFATLACQALSPQATPTTIPTIVRPPINSIPLTEADVPRIEVHEAKAALDAGQVILIDVRSADSYAFGHAAGAISIPLQNFEDNIGSLSLEKSQWIITYCT